jgi:integrase/recombinase XerD
MNWQNGIRDYQLYLRIERGFSKNTIESYSRDLEKLLLFLDENEMVFTPISIDEVTIQQFIYAIAKKVNPRSQARIISGLRSFFDYLIFEDYRATNPTDLIEAPKIGRKLPDTLSKDEISELFKSLRALNLRLSFS